jgi:hypothetical protein
MPDSNLVTWINRETQKYLLEEGESPGSPKETKLLEYWHRERPKMCHDLGSLAPKLAFVLVMKEHQAVVEYLRAGLTAGEAEQEAARDWLIREPESERPTPVLSDLISMSAIQKA